MQCNRLQLRLPVGFIAKWQVGSMTDSRRIKDWEWKKTNITNLKIGRGIHCTKKFL